eukprot:1082157-Rhodomonas_salina.4
MSRLLSLSRHSRAEPETSGAPLIRQHSAVREQDKSPKQRENIAVGREVWGAYSDAHDDVGVSEL